MLFVEGSSVEVSLVIEGVVCRRVDREEVLRRSGRFESLHFTLPSPDRLMRVLSPVVGSMTVDMFCCEA